MLFFFFQAEDGIRDADVTGVQTCALPICEASKQVATVTSHAPLSDKTQEYLQQQLQNYFPNIKVDFLIDTEQAVGVVLQVAGARVAWTLETYIDELQSQFAQQYKANVSAGSLL